MRGDKVRVTKGERRGTVGRLLDFESASWATKDKQADTNDTVVVKLFSSKGGTDEENGQIERFRAWDVAHFGDEGPSAVWPRPLHNLGQSGIEYGQALQVMNGFMQEEFKWVYDHVLQFLSKQFPDEKNEWAPLDALGGFQIWMPYSGWSKPVGFWHTDKKWNFEPLTALRVNYENGTCNHHDLRSIVIPLVVPDVGSPARLRLLLRDRPTPGATVLADDAPLKRQMKLPHCNDDASATGRGKDTFCLKDHVHQLGKATIFPSVLAHQVQPWQKSVESGPRVSLNTFGMKCTTASGKAMRYWTGG